MRQEAADLIAERKSFTDARAYLTWRGRFAGAVGKVYNFYSSTEDALAEYDGEVPTTSLGALGVVILNDASIYSYVWAYQEKTKGNRQDYYLPFLGSFHAGSRYGGWGFNLKDPLLPDDPVYYDFISFPDVYRTNKTPAEVISLLNFGTINNDVLQRHPFFEPGWGVVGLEDRLVDVDVAHFCGPAWIMGLIHHFRWQHNCRRPGQTRSTAGRGDSRLEPASGSKSL